MVEPATTIVGALIGAVIGVIWSDPYRDNLGRYTTRRNGFGSWVWQAVMGGFLGAIFIRPAMILIASNPLFGILGGLVILYMTYSMMVDPR
ncbi:hypothetical protein [Halolamina pelagica]|uniref:hypothetical protein n=1 Tax=Halolamina pelagica TaxID=699431 RepID=UPI001187486D|nr:hypothetical protein [Halolamina pelagica]